MSSPEMHSGAAADFSSAARRPFTKRLYEGMVGSPLGRAGARFLIPITAEVGVTSMEVDEAELENVAFLKDPLDSGYKLIVVANHQSLGDVAPIVYVARAISNLHSERIKGFDLFVAKTLGGGQQTRTSEVFFNEGANPWLSKQGIKTIEVVSDNDVETRNVRKDTASMIGAVRALRNNEKGILMFPEGTMRGGRRNAQGEINGIGVMSKSSRALFEHIVSREIRVVFLPVGIHGTYESFSPDKGNFTFSGGRAIALNYFRSNKERLGEVHIGEPFTTTDLDEVSDPGYEIMRRISELVPEEARGIFKSSPIV